MGEGRGVTEYWIWSNEHQAWWKPAERGYTGLLHEAGRYHKSVVDRILRHANIVVDEEDFPNVVAIPVTNNYMTGRSLSILEDFERTQTLHSWEPRQL
jgi:hypothetical protein